MCPENMKPLHLARSVDELESRYPLDVSDLPSNNLESLIISAFKKAEHVRLEDQEESFLLFKRGIEIFDRHFLNSGSKVSQNLKSAYDSAIRSYMNLKECLLMRYIENLPVCADPLPSKSENSKVNCEARQPVPNAANFPTNFPGRWIPPDTFYEMILDKKSLFLVDLRPEEQYTHKRISSLPQINFTLHIYRGATISTVENRMNESQREAWRSHGSAEIIVLFDLNSGTELIANHNTGENLSLPSGCTLKKVFDALVTYNANKLSLPSVVFLAGGFEEFEKRYPTFISIKEIPMVSSTSKSLGQYNIANLSDGESQSDEEHNVDCTNNTARESLDVGSGGASTETQEVTTSYADMRKILKELEISMKPPHWNSSAPKLVQPPPIAPLVFHPKPKPEVDRSTKPRGAQNIPRSTDTESVSSLSPRRTPSYGQSNEESFKYPIPKVDRSTKPKSSLQTSASSGNLDSSSRGTVKAAALETPKVDRSNKPREPAPLQNVQMVPLCRGLVNMGNTCYMNSSLQCLLHTPDLWKYFASLESRRGHIANLFAELVLQMSDPKEASNAFRPIKFKSSFGKIFPMFSGCDQQDSHEFLMILLDALHEELNDRKQGQCHESTDELDSLLPDEMAELTWSRNRATDNSIILNLFNGQLRSTVCCLKCQRHSYTFDEFMYLSVPVKESRASDLSICIEEFFKPEHLTGSSQWLCPQCDEPRDAVKTFDIWRLPKYLIVHLKRFQCDVDCRKIESIVHFPLTGLDLARFTQNKQVANFKYDLCGVINHHGSVNSGHYIAFCYDTCSREWLSFDDARVTVLTLDKLQTKAAYVLFYKRAESAGAPAV